jgi:hypothetical protein
MLKADLSSSSDSDLDSSDSDSDSDPGSESDWSESRSSVDSVADRRQCSTSCHDHYCWSRSITPRAKGKEEKILN